MTPIEYNWDCYVTSVGRKYFWARMKERIDQIVEHEGRIPIAKVTKRDRNVFGVGAIFEMRCHRGRIRLIFSHRRWTKAELEQVERDATELRSKLLARPSLLDQTSAYHE